VEAFTLAPGAGCTEVIRGHTGDAGKMRSKLTWHSILLDAMTTETNVADEELPGKTSLHSRGKLHSNNKHPSTLPVNQWALQPDLAYQK